jgi:CHAD domain-containing protein
VTASAGERPLPSPASEVEQEPSRKDVDVRAGAAIRAMLSASVERLTDNEDGAIEGKDDEAVHQARVGIRRLRADLSTLRPLLAEGTLEPLDPDLRWVGRKLGRARDADVQMARLRAAVDRLPRRDRPAADRLVRALDVRRADAHQKLTHAMGGRRFATVRDASVALALSPPLRDPSAPAGEAFRPLMRERWRALQEAAQPLSAASSDEELHHLRILAKRARYAAEGFSSVFGEDARRFGKLAAALQEVLGEHQDAVVAQAWLRRGSRSLGRSSAFVAGELFAGEQRLREVAREEWPQAWRSLLARGPRFWS